MSTELPVQLTLAVQCGVPMYEPPARQAVLYVSLKSPLPGVSSCRWAVDPSTMKAVCLLDDAVPPTSTGIVNMDTRTIYSRDGASKPYDNC